MSKSSFFISFEIENGFLEVTVNKVFIYIYREKAVAYTGNQGIEQAMDW